MAIQAVVLFLLLLGTGGALRAAVKTPMELSILVHLDGYDNETDGLKDALTLENALKEVKPFSKYSAAIGFHVLPFTADSLCRTKRAGPKEILECDPALIERVNRAGIEHFKFVVLSRRDFVPNAKVARGKNSTIFLSSLQPSMTPGELKNWLRLMFLHEFGHAFGLRDEFGRVREESGIVDREAAAVPSNNLAYRPGRPNCAPDLKTAKEWWGEFAGVEGTGYFSGCAGKMEYIRPSEDKLMSGFAKEFSYGFVSQNYLDQVMNCFYLGDNSGPCKKFRKTFKNFWKE